MAESKYRTAQKVMTRYYTQLVSRMADDVLERRDTIEQPYVEGGSEVVDRYAAHLQGACMLIAHLKRAGDREEGVAPQPPKVAVEEFRCPPEEVGTKVKTWFEQHPGAWPLALQVVPADKDVMCLIVHGDRPAPREATEEA